MKKEGNSLRIAAFILDLHKFIQLSARIFDETFLKVAKFRISQGETLFQR
jgi:hypothetical protein